MTLSDLLARGDTRLRLACATCGRRGDYSIARMIRQSGDARLTDLLATLTADCPRRRASQGVYDRCGAIYVGL